MPPKVADDQELYQRRSLSMTWTPDRRELLFGGRLPLEQGLAFEQAIWHIATEQRAAAKKTGETLDWQQSTADALVTLAEHHGTPGGPRRSPTTLIVHVSDRRARRTRRRRAQSASRPPSASPATRAAWRSSRRAATSCTHASAAAPPTPSNAHCTTAPRTASTPAAPPCANCRPTTSWPSARGGRDRTRQPHPALPPPPQAPPRPPHPHQRQRRPPPLRRRRRTPHHHQPTTRTTPRPAARPGSS